MCPSSQYSWRNWSSLRHHRDFKTPAAAAVFFFHSFALPLAAFAQRQNLPQQLNLRPIPLLGSFATSLHCSLARSCQISSLQSVVRRISAATVRSAAMKLLAMARLISFPSLSSLACASFALMPRSWSTRLFCHSSSGRAGTPPLPPVRARPRHHRLQLYLIRLRFVFGDDQVMVSLPLPYRTLARLALRRSIRSATALSCSAPPSRHGRRRA